MLLIGLLLSSLRLVGLLLPILLLVGLLLPILLLVGFAFNWSFAVQFASGWVFLSSLLLVGLLLSSLLLVGFELTLTLSCNCCRPLAAAGAGQDKPVQLKLQCTAVLSYIFHCSVLHCCRTLAAAGAQDKPVQLQCTAVDYDNITAVYCIAGHWQQEEDKPVWLQCTARIPCTSKYSNINWQQQQEEERINQSNCKITTTAVHYSAF